MTVYGRPMSEAVWHVARVTLLAGADPEGEQADLLSALLFEAGTEGIEIRDQDDPPQLVVSFPPQLTPAAITEVVVEALEQAGLPYGSVTVEPVPPVDWATHWRQHFTPLCFGRLWVVPTWLEAPASAEQVLRIDPSSAFGTGLHATTALCLERVDALCPVPRILDVGTGTGILALAALAPGAASALATDNDPEALRVADENAAQNGLPLITISGSGGGGQASARPSRSWWPTSSAGRWWTWPPPSPPPWRPQGTSCCPASSAPRPTRSSRRTPRSGWWSRS